MDENTNIETGTENQGQNQEEKTTYSKEEVEALLQKETDRRVTAALQKQERKNAEKIKEAEKLAKMNADEQFQYQLEQREKAIAEKEAALALAENKNAASKILSEKGLSLQLVDFVVAEDAEEMDSRIKTLEKAFKASVKAEVERRLGNKTPTAGASDSKPMTKDAFKKLTLKEQLDLYNSDQETYKSFF